MRLNRFTRWLAALWCALLLLPGVPEAKTRTTHSSRTVSSSHSKPSVRKSSKTTRGTGKRRATKRAASWKRGQQTPDSARAKEIQEALIRERYLSGTPSGQWDQQTKDALAKFQKDNGWQNKVIPDSRALIKLGLGPSRDGLLNPDSAAIATPHLAGSPQGQPGGSASN